jgi:glutamate-1-semialdehyde 2,1-aminomutase
VTTIDLTTDTALRTRAARVIPGGMYGHMNAGRLPAGLPQYFARAEGARTWDVDGREYVDLMCSYGPMVLGYGHPTVEAAADAQRRAGDCMSGPAPVLVELAELLVDTVAHADWAMFAKNGTDATTLCLTIARAATGRSKVLVARGAYHGAAPWCTPAPAGVTTADRSNLVTYDYNDLGSVDAAFAEAGDDVAAVIVTPFRHDARHAQELALPEFATGLRERCTARGAALVLDDVRCGLRIDIAGSWEPFGVRPDLSAFSKAIANGHPLAAVTGVDALREAATKVFTTGSFWFAAAPMAASVATITVARDTNAIATLAAAGQRLRDGIAAQAASYGLEVAQTGPAQMPMLTFADDDKFAKADAFAVATARAGALVHPWHNWFVSAAHTDDDIDRALTATDAGLAHVRATFGAG